ncbi:MAG: hypothetical protein KDI30_11890 [Pseudomonadales bacterium]|nr:hypothetical protein [Pseudomonadales bacterium]
MKKPKEESEKKGAHPKKILQALKVFKVIREAGKANRGNQKLENADLGGVDELPRQ